MTACSWNPEAIEKMGTSAEACAVQIQAITFQRSANRFAVDPVRDATQEGDGRGAAGNGVTPKAEADQNGQRRFHGAEGARSSDGAINTYSMAATRTTARSQQALRNQIFSGWDIDTCKN